MFGHRPATLKFWRRLVQQALTRVATPFHLFSTDPLAEVFEELATLECPVPVRHWFSCKTQPLAPMLRYWKAHGGGVEVVSEFELSAALAEGFSPEQILVNGPAKQHWLPQVARPLLRVNFDSLTEMRALLPLARRLEWSLGVRCRTSQEVDPAFPDQPTQFGMESAEAISALRLLQQKGLRVETVHFHLRTNVPRAGNYETALEEVARICAAASFTPRNLDLGGGFPPPHTRAPGGAFLNAAFDLREMAGVLRRTTERFPGTDEIWLENGRFVTARCGVLVVRVLEAKERQGVRQLICDGGRTLHALVSTWEDHELLVVPQRQGPCLNTIVYGPTCMAFDQLARRPLPRSVQPGDHLVWMDAGAYHLSWETRFSHGLAPVVWHEGGQMRVARPREDFAGWWEK